MVDAPHSKCGDREVIGVRFSSCPCFVTRLAGWMLQVPMLGCCCLGILPALRLICHQLNCSSVRRSGRITKPVEKYDPSPRPRTPRIRTRPGVPKSLRRSGSSIVKTIKSALNEAWENTPQRMGPPSIRTRSRSRETRAASLEKLNQPGSIKINKSLCLDKRSRDSVANKSASRQGSREVEGESSSWTDSEDDIDKRKEGGIHVIGKRKVLIAKVEKE